MKPTIITIIVMLFMACATDSGKPKDMLTDEQMVDVLVELHLAEARMDLLQIPQDSVRPLLRERYTEIFTDQNLDTAKFNATFAYYERYPEQMDSLYQKVIDELVEREALYRQNAPDSTNVTEADSAQINKLDSIEAATNAAFQQRKQQKP